MRILWLVDVRLRIGAWLCRRGIHDVGCGH